VTGGEDAVGFVVEEGGAHQVHLPGTVEVVEEDEMGEPFDILEPCNIVREQFYLSDGLRDECPLNGRIILAGKG
jgi:hypothetical protein